MNSGVSTFQLGVRSVSSGGSLEEEEQSATIRVFPSCLFVLLESKSPTSPLSFVGRRASELHGQPRRRFDYLCSYGL